MKPAPFLYFRPDTLEEALALMHDHGGDAKPLAGGQSLVPAMNFRLAQPAVLVDLNRLDGLASITPAGDGGLSIGGMTRHRTLEHDATVGRLVPLVSHAMPFVAHPPIRTRGTLGGSLAHADPAAELPAVMLALDAAVVVRNRSRARSVPADEFFLGLYATALDPDELVLGVVIPPAQSRTGWAIDEVARRHGDYALAGAAASVSLAADGTVTSVRVALFGVHERPVVARQAADALIGSRPDERTVSAAAAAAASGDADPSSDVHASADYRRHLTGVVVRRVLTRCCARARAGTPT